MSDDDVRVQIIADAAGVAPAMQQASTAVEAGTKKMERSLEEVGVVSEAVAHRMEHLALSVTFAASALADGSERGVHRAAHSLAGFGLAFGPLVGAMSTALAIGTTRMLEFFTKAREEAKKTREAVEKEIGQLANSGKAQELVERLRKLNVGSPYDDKGQPVKPSKYAPGAFEGSGQDLQAHVDDLKEQLSGHPIFPGLLRVELEKVNEQLEEANKKSRELKAAIRNVADQPAESTRTPIKTTAKAPSATEKEILNAAKEEWDKRKAAANLGADALLQLEVQFWTSKLSLVKGHSEEDVAIRRAMNAMIAQAQYQLANDTRAAAGIEARGREQAQLAAIDVEVEAVERRRDLRQQDAATTVSQLQSLATRSLAIELDGLTQQYDLAEGDFTKRAELWAQMEEAKRKHEKKMAEIARDGVKEQDSIDEAWVRDADERYKAMEKEREDQWHAVFQTIESSWDKAAQAFRSGADTLQNFWRDIWHEMVATSVRAFIEVEARTAAHWLAVNGITAAGVAKDVGMFAIRGAAAAWSAAIEEFGVAGVAIGAGLATLVLEGILALSHGGGSGSASGTSTSTSTTAAASAPSSGAMHVTINAMDAKSFHSYAMENSDIIAKAAIHGSARGVRLANTSGRGSV